jgi:hypothetical protein
MLRRMIKINSNKKKWLPFFGNHFRLYMKLFYCITTLPLATRLPLLLNSATT